MTYVASLIIPFKKCSFVIKVQCMERGVTGIREALLMDRAIAKGELDLEKLAHGELPAIDFDNEQYHAEFPDHPLTRVRMEMRRILSSIQVDPELGNLKQFRLPSSANMMSDSA